MTRVGPAARRVSDRLRPWAAPLPPDGAPDIAVIGAGPAGLATAALLRRAHVRAIVFDRDERIGSSWADRYDSLRLNTVRWMSDLPGRRMERSLGRWVGQAVASSPTSNGTRHITGWSAGWVPTTVSSIERSGDEWTVSGESGAVSLRCCRRGDRGSAGTPIWPFLAGGPERFSGRLLQARGGLPPSDEHLGARVLVVGAGSSGGEICVDSSPAPV